jgi:hypothetical protein
MFYGGPLGLMQPALEARVILTAAGHAGFFHFRLPHGDLTFI